MHAHDLDPGSPAVVVAIAKGNIELGALQAGVAAFTRVEEIAGRAAFPCHAGRSHRGRCQGTHQGEEVCGFRGVSS